MAQRRQAHNKGSLFNPGDCAAKLAKIPWVIVTFDTDVKIARPIFIRGGEDSS
jgi:hypothetical protein